MQAADLQSDGTDDRGRHVLLINIGRFEQIWAAGVNVLDQHHAQYFRHRWKEDVRPCALERCGAEACCRVAERAKGLPIS